jgi:hypothetical protein
MFWIILSIISLILAGAEIYRCYHKDEDLRGIGVAYMMTCAISSIIVIILGVAGITDYPYLNKELIQIETLENRVEDIRNASYKYKKDGNFVAGSIENINQSTNLTKYISDLAKKEASYNGYLQKVKDYKEIFVLKFFGDGWAISDKVYDLPVIE